MVRFKNIIIMIITLVVEVAITYYLAYKFSMRFIDIMFFTGMAFAFISFYFSSSGGMLSDHMSSATTAHTAMVQKRDPFVFKRGPIFTASFIFFIISVVVVALLMLDILPKA